MWTKCKSFYLRYINYSEYSKSDGLPYIIDQLFISIIITSFPLSLLIYIPSIVFLLGINMYITVVADLISFLIFVIILLNKKQKIATKKLLFIFNFYILALALLVLLGSKGPGIIIFLSISIVSTLLINKKAGLISVAIIAATHLMLLLGFSIASENLYLFQEYSQISWFFTSLNFTILNLMIVIVLSFFIDHLQNFILSEHQLLTQLKKESESLLEAKHKSEESDRLKSAFLANMSHEIRTPMNGILGFSDLLQNSKLTGEQQKKYIELIQKSGNRMLNLINDIVSISKIESGTLDIYLTETNVNTQLQFIYDLLKLEADKKKLNLTFTCAFTDEEAIIETDQEKLYGILSNLVKNAIKYTDTGTIEYGYIKKRTELEFFVKDSGIGIQKERLDAIFERFIQADIIDKMARQGAGLGLTISKAYVEMLGGKIWVESKEAKGSTFFFTLPCNLESKLDVDILTDITPVNRINLKTAEIPGLKVLIAEDDEVSEMLISTELNKFSKEILKAKNGIEAIETCRQNPDIDLVLMDIQMPEMNGYQATREIRKLNKNVIIIAQTAYALAGDKDKAIEVGCNNYISKPIRQDELLLLLQLYFA